MLPSLPSGSSVPSSSRIRISTPGNGRPMPVPPGSRAPRAQPGAGDEAELRGAVVFEDGGVGCPAARRLEGPGVQFGAGADDAADAGGVDAAGQAALAEQPEHGGHQDQPGDAVVADGGVGVADVEVLQGVEFRAGVQAFGQGIEVQACRERPGGQGLVVLAKAEELDGGVEGLLPGPPRAGEGLGDRGGAGGQADQERGLRAARRQARSPARERTAPDAVSDPAMRAAMPSWSCWRPGRVQHGALTLTRHGRRERDGEVGELCSDRTVTAGAEGTSAAARSRRSDQLRCAPATTTAVSSGRSSAQRWSLSRKGIEPTLPLPSAPRLPVRVL